MSENNTIEKACEILNKGWSKQIILYGPPGTSKTYSSTIIAAQLLTGDENITDYDKAKKLLAGEEITVCGDANKLLEGKEIKGITVCGDAEKLLTGEGITVKKITGDQYEIQIVDAKNRFKLVQFHPAYTYEDFVRGITVKASDDGVTYEVTAKVFEQFCDYAKNNATEKFVFMIDEINRAPLSSVLGELIYGLEYRNQAISTPYALNGNSQFTVPDNVYIIGTMNTADRSIGTIDYAVRRRFAFLPVLPEPEPRVIADSWANDPEKTVVGKKTVGETAADYYKNVRAIFEKGSTRLMQGVNGDDIAIGHTYFLGKKNKEADTKAYLDFRMYYQVKPILEEYVKDGLLDTSLTEKADWFDTLLNPEQTKPKQTT